MSKLSKRTKIMIISGAVVLVLAAVLTVLLLLPSQNPEANISADPTYEKRVFSNRSRDDVESAVIEQKGQELSVKVERDSDGNLALPDLKGIPYYDQAFSEMIVYTYDCVADKIVDENPEDLSQYGLSDPQATVTVKYKDGSTMKILIGDKLLEANGSGYYVQLEGRDTVYVGDNDFIPFMTPLKNYIITELIDTSTVQNGADFQYLTITNQVNDQPIAIIKNTVGSDETDPVKKVVTHLLVSPIDAYMDPTPNAALIESLFQVNAKDIVVLHPTDAQKAEYGFDKPTATADIDIITDTTTADSTNYVLTLGKATEDGSQYYIMESKSDAIFVVDASAVPWKDVKVFDLIVKKIHTPYIHKLSGIEVGDGKNEYRFDIASLAEGEEDKISVTCNGKELDSDLFKSFYQMLVSLTVENPVEEGTKVSAKPVLTIRMEYADGTTEPIEMELIPKDDRSVYVRDGEKVLYTMRSSYAPRLLEELGKLLKGEAIDVAW